MERPLGDYKPQMRTGRFEKTDATPAIVGQLFPSTSGSPPPQTLNAARQEFERHCLQHVLAQSDGKRAAASKIVGISRKNLWEKLRGDKPRN
jgi:DNA-binding NtrC family response regulator